MFMAHTKYLGVYLRDLTGSTLNRILFLLDFLAFLGLLILDDPTIRISIYSVIAVSFLLANYTIYCDLRRDLEVEKQKYNLPDASRAALNQVIARRGSPVKKQALKAFIRVQYQTGERGAEMALGRLLDEGLIAEQDNRLTVTTKAPLYS
jgi:hypothetical protein